MRLSYKLNNILGSYCNKKTTIKFTPDGNSVVSSLGNQLHVFDLIRNTSYILPTETITNIVHFCISPNGKLLLAMDSELILTLVDFERRFVWGKYFFVEKSGMDSDHVLLQFSPDGQKFLVASGNIQIFESPNEKTDLVERTEFKPNLLHHIPFFRGNITHIEWSPKSDGFLLSSDLCVSICYSLEYNVKIPLSSGNKSVIGSYYSKDGNQIYVILKNKITIWTYDQASQRFIPVSTPFMEHDVKSSAFNRDTSLLVIGMANGVFKAYEMPNKTPLFQLGVESVIATIDISRTGDWFVFGCPQTNQLLVWEWKSERFVLNQKGNMFGAQSLAYSHDGKYIAAGGKDGVLKIWKAEDGFCFVSFTDHTFEITDLCFIKDKQIVLTSSLDGTVRAFDLFRYRNFKILTSPEPRQFTCVAVDQSGEIVAAGCLDTFEIFVWDFKTGRLLDILESHEGPVCTLAFSSHNNHLVSGSWDNTVKIWDVYAGGNVSRETIQFTSSVLKLAMRPDGKRFAVATARCTIELFEVQDAQQLGIIDGKAPLQEFVNLEQPLHEDRFYSSIAFSADGSCVLGCSNTNNVCLFDVDKGMLLRKFKLSDNVDVLGVPTWREAEELQRRQQTKHVRRSKTEHVQQHARKEGHEAEDALEKLPGVTAGKYGQSHEAQRIGATAIAFSPTDRQWAVCTSVGIEVFSLDTVSNFDPYQLDVDVTETNILQYLKKDQYFLAFIMALKLNILTVTVRVFEAIPYDSFKQIIVDISPAMYLIRILTFLSMYLLQHTPHVQYVNEWVQVILSRHGQFIRDNRSEFAPVLRNIRQHIANVHQQLQSLCTTNDSLLRYMQNYDKLVDIPPSLESLKLT